MENKDRAHSDAGHCLHPELPAPLSAFLFPRSLVPELGKTSLGDRAPPRARAILAVAVKPGWERKREQREEEEPGQVGGERRGPEAVGGKWGGEHGFIPAVEAETGLGEEAGAKGRGGDRVRWVGQGAGPRGRPHSPAGGAGVRRGGAGRSRSGWVGEGPTAGRGSQRAGAEPCRSAVRLLQSCAARQHPGRGAPGEEGEETR